MDTASAHNATITNEELPEGTGQLGADLHYMLILFTKGPAQTIARNVQNNCGLETWRQLSQYYQLPNTSKAMGRLSTILNFPTA